MKSVWLQVLTRLQEFDRRLPAAFPPELPAESAPNFWFRVAQIEMQTRDTLSAKVRLLVAGPALPAMTALEAWLYRRRAEWAAQVVLGAAQKGLEPSESLPQVLEYVLVQSWERDGCIGLWNHAERGGQPHPENPDGLSPLS